MGFVKIFELFEINFKNIAFAFFKIEITIFLFPFETGVWKRLTHRPPIEIIRVIVHDVVVVFLWVIIAVRGLLAFACLFKTIFMPPRMPFSMNMCTLMSVQRSRFDLL